VTEFAAAKPVAVYDTRHGLGGDDVFRIWQDSRGDLWFATFGQRVLARRDRITGKFVAYDERDGLPRATPTAFAEDRAGDVWLGQFAGGIVRRRGQRFEHFTEKDGVPPGQIRAMLVDRNGALWIATRNAIVRIADPAAARPVITPVPDLSTAGALSLDRAPNGDLIVGTPHGVELYDRQLRPRLRLSTTDGLAQNEMTAAYADRTGALWLGTVAGLSYVPRLPTFRPFPPVRPRILSIDAGTSPVPLAELGAGAVDGVRLRWPDRRMTVAFSAPDFDPRHPLQFEYRLHDDKSWTNAGARRSVTYERLSFGNDRFEVRAIGGEGTHSQPATVTFTVVPPFWRTPWFAAMTIAALIATVIALHRVRVAHLLALQRIRTRVATDLHDDLGSSLSRISILSELANRRGAKGADGERVLEEIGTTARSLIDALGDSIWSIDPRRDDVQSLMARLRHFAADVLEAKSIAMQFDVSPALSATPLTPDRRREVFLILKEAINNAAKHSQATRVVVTLHADGGHLHACVADDGIGIDRAAPPRADGGHGLSNMSARAERAGGTLVIATNGAAGTRIDVAIPL
ncbi:MAG: ATP-binding protein, partial [Acidobacteria bacterium]|nr:ATP-binding protein [Acidobacteriota bacterium]